MLPISILCEDNLLIAKHDGEISATLCFCNCELAASNSSQVRFVFVSPKSSDPSNISDVSAITSASELHLILSRKIHFGCGGAEPLSTGACKGWSSLLLFFLASSRLIRFLLILVLVIELLRFFLHAEIFKSLFNKKKKKYKKRNTKMPTEKSEKPSPKASPAIRRILEQASFQTKTPPAPKRTTHIAPAASKTPPIPSSSSSLNSNKTILQKVEESFTHMMACMHPSKYAIVMRQRIRDISLYRSTTLDTTCPSCQVSLPGSPKVHSPLPVFSLRPVMLRPCTSAD